MNGGRKEIAIPLRVSKEQSKSSIPSDVASAFNIASFNASAALGAYAGGLVVSSVFGLQAAPLAAAILWWFL